MQKNQKASGILPWLLQDALPLLLILLCNAIIATVCSEALWRASLSEAVFWLFSRVRFSCWDIAIAFSFSLFLAALTRRVALSVCLNNLLMAVLSLIHFFKLDLRDEPLLLTDIWQAEEALDVAGEYSFALGRVRLLLLLVMILLPLLVLAGIRLRRISFPYRAVTVLFTAFLYAASLFQADALFYTVRLASFRTYYFSAGVPCGLVGTRPRKMKKPEGYSEEAVAQALQGAARQTADPGVLPDIFFIMGETFYDPARISGLEIGGEVFPRLKALQEEGWGGSLLVSQYGGGTAQTEYEVLTGYRSGDTPGTAYVTSGTMKKDMDSVVSLLAAHGYYTQAMHPSDGGTYSRSKAYARLGFESRVFRKNMSKVTATVGTIPADSWFFPEILRQYDARPADRPYFSFIVTFQNHGGYLNKTVPWTIPVSGVSGDAQISAHNYINGLHLTDEALGSFCDALRESGRPAVVVFFGDHAPSLSAFSSGNGQGGAGSVLSAHLTPLLVWSNYGLDTSSLPEIISSYRLSAVIMDLLGFRDDAYLSSLVTAPDLYKDDGFILKGDRLVTDAPAYEAESERLRLLHYDRLEGKNWSAGFTN